MIERLTWHSPHLLPAALACAAGAGGLGWWIYRDQVSLTRSWRWMLAALRASVIVTLAVIALRPAVVRTKSSGEYGAVVVLLDRSRSMGVVDNSRSPSQLVELADALRRLPPGARQRLKFDVQTVRDELEAIAHDLRLARSELDYAILTDQPTQNAQSRLQELTDRARILLDRVNSIPAIAALAESLVQLTGETNTDSAKWSRELDQVTERLDAALAQAQSTEDQSLYEQDSEVRQSCDQVARMSRLSLAEEALVRPHGLLHELSADNAPVYGFAFDSHVEPLPLLGENRQPVRRVRIDSSGRGSDLEGALRAVREQFMRGQPVQSIVVISDGRQAASSRQAPLASSVSSTAPPVFTVSAAAPVRCDIAVQRVEAPTTLRSGQTARIVADVAGIGVGGRPIEVRADINGQTFTRVVTLNDRQPVRVEFASRIAGGGAARVAVKASPQPGEITDANNTIAATINVIDRPLNVVLIGSAPDHEYQSLAAMLKSIEWLHMTESLSSPAAISPAQLRRQQVVILCGASRASLSDDQLTALDDNLHRGGGVIIAPSLAHPPSELAALPVLARLLPFHDVRTAGWRSWDGDEPAFAVAPAVDGAAPKVRLAQDDAEDRRLWDDLPQVYRVLPVNEPKPGAQTLAVERDSGAAVLTAATIGAGRALFLGVEETWRWSQQPDAPDLQSRFWLSLIHLAANDPAEELTTHQDAELADVSGDEAHLRRLATAGGGEMLKLTEIDELPQKIRAARERQPQFTEYRLWDSPYLFALVLGCLGLEWSLRKGAGLP
jgi:hypothetical protein